MMLPRKDYIGTTATVTMMEFRAQPGEVADRVAAGMRIHVTKQGKHIMTIIPAGWDSETTVVRSDGSFVGQPPLTFRKNLGDKY